MRPSTPRQSCLLTKHPLSKSNLTAKTILKDLSDVKKIKKLSTKKNQKRIEKLIYFIVQTLRRLTADHLIETTSIWVLINLIEENAEFSRRVMLHAGVPGVLCGILNSHTSWRHERIC